MLRKNAYAAVLLVAALACSDSPGGIETPVVSRVEVGPADRVLVVGDTMRLTAYPTTNDGTVVGGVPIAWVSEDADVAGVTNLGIHGVVLAKAPGSVRISATAEGRTGSVRVTVTAAPLQVASVEITPNVLALQPGQEHPVEAVLRAADGTVIGGRAITWSSSSSPTVTATSYGNVSFAMLRAQSAGFATITATSEGVSGTAHVTVATWPANVHSITLTPADTIVAIGAELTMRAVLRAADGAILTGRTITWTSTAPEYAAVDQHGNVRALGAGNVAIRATAEGVTGQAAVRVQAAVTPVAHVHIQPYAKSAWVDHVVAFSGVALAQNGTVLEGRTLTWSIEDSTIAAVNPATGQVRGRRPGVTKVRATAEGVTGQAELHVFPIPLGVVTYALTYDWWDGQVRVAEPMGTVTWTDAAGVERTAELSLMGGSITMDHSAYPYAYTRTLLGEAYAVVDGVLQKVAERRVEDSGTVMMVTVPGGHSRWQFTSAVTPGLTYQARPRGHGEMEVRTEVGGRIADVLFRQRP